MWRTSVLAALLSCAACSTPPPPATTFPSGRLVDLSHAYDAHTIFWPTAEPFTLEVVSNGITDKGYFYAANNFSGSEHGGTHLDAPVHFSQTGQTAEAIPLDRLVGAAVIVDVTAAASANRDYLVTVADIERAEREDGVIPTGAIVLVRTGFSTRWPDAESYLGTAERGEAAVAKLHFPGIDPEAARWLIMNRQPKAVGIDTASIDYGQSTLYETHRALFAQNIPAFENLTNLDQLPKQGASIVALPMKIGGGSGGPLRAIAIVPEG